MREIHHYIICKAHLYEKLPKQFIQSNFQLLNQLREFARVGASGNFGKLKSI